MGDNKSIPLPSVPDADGVRAYISVADPGEVVPDVSELLTGPEDVSLRSLLFGPGVVPATVAGYAVAGEDGLSNVESEVEEWASNLDYGKISKYDSYYFPQTPIPFGVWEYKCATCRFYVSPEESDNGQAKCSVVGQDGDLFGGENIHPQGWCSLWLPHEAEPWFDYVTERLESEVTGHSHGQFSY